MDVHELHIMIQSNTAASALVLIGHNFLKNQVNYAVVKSKQLLKTDNRFCHEHQHPPWYLQLVFLEVSRAHSTHSRAQGTRS